MKDLNLTSLRLFVAVCDAGSIVRVAERERVVPSSITKRLAKLEEVVGAALLERVRQGVAPTAAGRLLCEQSRGLVDAADEVVRNVGRLSSGLVGTITLGVAASILAGPLPEDLESFMSRKEFRGVRLNIQELTSTDLVQAVRDGRIAVGIIWDATESSGLEARPYRTEQLCCVVRRGHPLTDRQSVRADEAFAHDVIIMRNQRHSAAIIKRGDSKFDDVSLRARIEVPTYEAGLRMAAAGLGVFVCHRSTVGRYADLLDLAMIPIREAWAENRYALISRSSTSLPPYVRSLIEHLAKVDSEAIASIL
ncbi:MAG: hypothetical protein RIS35_1409 [Pseudomonadota bacterium]|jgi:DNA-binding transcriptional LysR family regulator